MLDTDQILQLEEHFAGRLKEPAITELKLKIQNDPLFEKEVLQYQQIFEGLKALELEEFQSMMNTWEQKNKKQSILVQKANPSKLHIVRKYTYWIAAAIVIVVAIPLSFVLYQNLSQEDAESVFAANFEHYTAMSFTTRSGSASGNPSQAEEEDRALKIMLNQGILEYNAKNYERAINYMSQYLSMSKEDVNNNEVRFYLAVSHLSLNNTAFAKETFEELAKGEKRTAIHDASDWYLALTLIKENNIKQAQKELKAIANKKRHRYKDKAVELLNNLEK